MRTIVVRTTCVADVRERFEVMLADDADVNLQSWSGSGGIEEAIANGQAVIVKHGVTHIDDERDRQVTFTREVSDLADAG